MNNESMRLLVEFKLESSKRLPGESQHKAIGIETSDDPYQQWLNLHLALVLTLNNLTADNFVSIRKVYVLWNVLHSYVVKQDLEWSATHAKADPNSEDPEPEIKVDDARCQDIVIALRLMKERDCWDRLCVEYSVKDGFGKNRGSEEWGGK